MNEENIMAQKTVRTLPQVPTLQPSPLFMQCLREGSNYELAWLWAATHLVQPEEQRYCLERALYINPDSQMARRGLRELAKTRPLYSSGVSFRFLSDLAQRLFGTGL
jgi:hypothetical protein